MPSCYECKTRAQGPWSSLHRLFPNNAASLEASAVMTVEKKRAAEISQRPAPALNEPRKLHCNPNCGSWASFVGELKIGALRVPLLSDIHFPSAAIHDFIKEGIRQSRKRQPQLASSPLVAPRRQPSYMNHCYESGFAFGNCSADFCERIRGTAPPSCIFR